jgi:hypothetical protein
VRISVYRSRSRRDLGARDLRKAEGEHPTSFVASLRYNGEATVHQDEAACSSHRSRHSNRAVSAVPGSGSRRRFGGRARRETPRRSFRVRRPRSRIGDAGGRPVGRHDRSARSRTAMNGRISGTRSAGISRTRNQEVCSGVAVVAVVAMTHRAVFDALESPKCLGRAARSRPPLRCASKRLRTDLPAKARHKIWLHDVFVLRARG